jgi:hypothetical protein
VCSSDLERIDHQAATIDVLKEMSASPGDAQPVFDLICSQTGRCSAQGLWGCSNMTTNWCITERQVAARRSPIPWQERPMMPDGPEYRTAGH